MKNSIVFKTSFVIIIALLFIMTFIGYYIQDNQSSIISKLQENQSTYIYKKLKNEEIKSIEKELEILKILSSSLTGTISSSLYNGDNLIAKSALNKFLIKDNIKAVTSYSKLDDETFVVAYKKNNKLIFQDSLPVEFKKLHILKYKLTYENEDIGSMEIYYDNSKIAEQLNVIKNLELKIFEEQSKEIKEEVANQLIKQTIIFIIGGLIIVLIIIVLLLNYVNKPLITFKKGLNSFFDYLSDATKKVQSIEIETSDEFGQMSKSINSSIEVSMKMHADIANLMKTMDKNIITSETDDKGIITYVSQAFCDISGYTKEELIGSPQNLIRHPDMQKEVFKNLWNTIQAGKTWEGEIKNLKKDGGFYWVWAIISPKCTKAGASCGYTAIRHDITSKKEIEELTLNLEKQVASQTKDIKKQLRIVKMSERKQTELMDVLSIAKKEIEATHKHTRESIEYASLIQGALLPDENLMANYFPDYFVHWEPKDTVGGDIWLFSKLRHQDECLLFFIDCTGHGVPGAFVTMIVKAVEREILVKIKDDPNMDVSPAWVMAYFNRTMKVLLKQEDKTSISNAGWDGGIIYYNRRTQILKFAGAETPLFYIDIDGELKTIKGNRYSVGYKKCTMDYEYKETIIDVEEGMKFYCTTDGYLDQNGGEKDFPFGKKRFGNIIKENHTIPMQQQKVIFIDEMDKYESMIPNNDRNDDMTMVSFEIGKQSDFIEDTIKEIVKYEGVMTQNVISTAMDNIEAKIQNMGVMGTLSTITIEYCQNMMNYSKGIRVEDGNKIIPAGAIEVLYHSNKYYEIIASNIVSIEDKEKIEPKLLEIQFLDKVGIKKRYRELRKSGQNTHEKGGGIGMYEIAKISDSVEYEFKAINEDKYYFTMRSFVKIKGKEAKNKE